MRVIGLKELEKALASIDERLADLELITRDLANNMRKFVHVETGYLRSTIWHKGAEAGADAPYAGYEEERHEYALDAIENFDVEKYLKEVTEEF